jgi:hypothetical protein
MKKPTCRVARFSYSGEGVDLGATRSVGVALGGGGGSSSSFGVGFGVGDSRWFVLRLLLEPKLPLTVVAGTCSTASAFTFALRGVGDTDGCDWMLRSLSPVAGPVG